LVSVTNSIAGSYILTVFYEDAGDGSYQINDFSVEVLSTLPVAWHSFAVAPRGNDAWIQWSTSSEQNTRDFNCTSIASMAAAGPLSVQRLLLVPVLQFQTIITCILTRLMAKELLPHSAN
jgi:hypothetical protein